MELTSLLAIDGVFETGVEVMTNLLGANVANGRCEIAAAEQCKAVADTYEQRAAFPVCGEDTILIAQMNGKGVPFSFAA